MTCPIVNAFFSCSFKDDDKDLNDYFKSLCEALNISCKNVSDGYSSTPPEVARSMIAESKAVLAVIPKREQTTSGTWTMPSAVHEEMAMAYALKKPTLIVVENDIKRDGFIGNFGTFISFERGNIYSNAFIKKMVSSLHELRMQAVEQHNLLPDQDAAGFYAESVAFLIELAQHNEKQLWNYTSTRKLVFTRLYEGQIKNSAWAEYIPSNASEKISYTSNITASRESINSICQKTKDTPQQLEISIDFDDKPQKDDWVEIEFSYASPYLNALHKTDVSDDKRTLINGKHYDCFDGLIPIQPTRDMHIQFRFPSWYRIDKGSIYPFVGSYSGGIDYIVESEIMRCKIEITKFGSSTQVDIRVESPLMRHVYGVAWNLDE